MGMINQFFIGTFSYPASLNCLRFFKNSEIVLQVETMVSKSVICIFSRVRLTLSLPELSADNLCKQFWIQNRPDDSLSLMFDILMAFLREIFEKVY